MKYIFVILELSIVITNKCFCVYDDNDYEDQTTNFIKRDHDLARRRHANEEYFGDHATNFTSTVGYRIGDDDDSYELEMTNDALKISRTTNAYQEIPTRNKMAFYWRSSHDGVVRTRASVFRTKKSYKSPTRLESQIMTQTRFQPSRTDVSLKHDPLSPEPLFIRTEPEYRLLNLLKSTTTGTTEAFNRNRICIFCNNVEHENCSGPKITRSASVKCNGKDDICYSEHTPFGIVTRGCSNKKKHVSTYLCSCNLCNHMSIFHLPHEFATKQDWVENIKDLIGMRRLRSSILKDTECLKCEVKPLRTNNERDVISNANCLEGNIESLPTEVCAETSMCAVKARPYEGYIWRGCVDQPSYNNWFTFCDEDFCNNDPVVSVHDELENF